MKTVIEMARQSGYGDHMSVLHAPALKRFAELVRADEREACAKVCDIEASVTVTNAAEQYQEGRSMGAAVCAEAIRARSNT